VPASSKSTFGHLWSTLHFRQGSAPCCGAPEHATVHCAPPATVSGRRQVCSDGALSPQHTAQRCLNFECPECAGAMHRSRASAPLFCGCGRSAERVTQPCEESNGGSAPGLPSALTRVPPICAMLNFGPRSAAARIRRCCLVSQEPVVRSGRPRAALQCRAGGRMRDVDVKWRSLTAALSQRCASVRAALCALRRPARLVRVLFDLGAGPG
jgi:hypothetical protein